jgi:hypothetical protein
MGGPPMLRIITRMSLKNVDVESALRRIADRRIEEAMREGKFDNLTGAGKPLNLEPMPAEENARMTWWMLRILHKNDFTPDEVRLRKSIETLKEQLNKLKDIHKLPPLVARINQLVHELNTLGTNAIDLAVTPVDLETEQALLRQGDGA